MFGIDILLVTVKLLSPNFITFDILVIFESEIVQFSRISPHIPNGSIIETLSEFIADTEYKLSKNI